MKYFEVFNLSYIIYTMFCKKIRPDFVHQLYKEDRWKQKLGEYMLLLLLALPKPVWQFEEVSKFVKLSDWFRKSSTENWLELFFKQLQSILEIGWSNPTVICTRL